MKTNLSHIASIQTGIFAKTHLSGDIIYLQAKHFDENGKLESTLYPDLKLDISNQKHLLKPGDVLFAAKGTKNFAAIYESSNAPAVASTSFFVIRLFESIRNNILPEFLVWLINHPISQKFLKGNAIGSSIPSISKTVLEEMEIFIPDLHTQKVVLKITKLRNREKILKEQIAILFEKLIQQRLVQVIKGKK